MMGKMYIFTLIICFIINSFFKKKDYICPMILCLFMIFLMGGQKSNQDYIIYKNIFEGPFYTKDIGFGIIIQFLKRLGFTSGNFRLGIALIGFSFINFSVFKLLKRRGLFYIFYGIYPFFFDVVQARNFLMMSLLIFAVPFLIDIDKKKINKYIFILIIFLASTIQKIALVYIPIPFVLGISNKSIRKNIIKGIIFVSIIFVFNKPFLNKFINIVILPISSSIQEITNYATINTNYGWIIFWTEQILAYSLVAFADYLSKKNKKQFNEINDTQSKFVTIMKDINFYMFIFLPLFILDENYTRIIRNLIPLNLIAIISALYDKNLKLRFTKYNCALLGCTFFYQILWFYFMSRNYLDTVILTTINNNWILDKF